MQSGLSLSGIGRLEHTVRAGDAGKFLRTAAAHLTCGLLGLFLSDLSVFSGLSPLGAALVCSVPAEYLPAAAIGSVTGGILSGSGFRYPAAILACVIIRIFFFSFLKPSVRAVVSPLLAAVSLSGTGIFLTALSGFDGGAALLAVGEGLLGGGMTYFFNQSISALSGEQHNRQHSLRELTSLTLSGAAVLLSFMRFEVFSLSPARMAALLLVMAAACYGRRTAGAVLGIAVGATLLLYDSALTLSAFGIILGGLTAGIFSTAPKARRIVVALSFLMTLFLCSLPVLSQNRSLSILYESGAAALVFILLPRGAEKHFLSLFAGSAGASCESNDAQSAALKLRFAGESLRNVVQTVDAVSEKLRRGERPELDTVFAQAEDEVCRGCGFRIYCWETAREETLTALIPHVTQNNPVPDSFCARCVKSEALCACLSRRYAAYRRAAAADARLREVRSVVSEQFEGISELLCGMAEELSDIERFDPETADAIAAGLRGIGLCPLELSCHIDRFGRLTCDIRLDCPQERRGLVGRAAVQHAAEAASGRDFDPPSLSFSDGVCLISLSEKAGLSIDFGAFQQACEGNAFCGDSYEYFCDGRGCAVLLISDGMGNGGRAAVDGAMASGLMSRLLKAGFSPECALKIVNAAMLYRSSDESLATVDLCRVDLFSGFAEFYKAGAPATVVCRSGCAGVIEAEALPAGILNETAFDKQSSRLSKGDIIVMMSDGAADDGTDWIGSLVEMRRDETAAELAKTIAGHASRRSRALHEDDVTVLVGILS